MAMELSVVIVNWNSGPYLARLLTSLRPLKDELEEIWVVDNASSDSSLDGLEDTPGVRILSLPQNQGFAGGANEGISRTSSNLILLLNPDVEVVSDSVRQLYQEMNKRPEAAIVCGSLEDPQGRSQSAFQLRPLPSWKSVLSDALFVDEFKQWVESGFLKRKSTAASVSSSPGGRKLDSEQPAAAAWLLRKEAWKEMGGFDTRFYPAWFEDVDYCKRLQDSRWQIFYFSHLPMIHRGGLALEKLSHSAFVEIFYRNLLRYLRKHHARLYPLLWLPVQSGMWIRRLLIRR